MNEGCYEIDYISMLRRFASTTAIPDRLFVKIQVSLGAIRSPKYFCVVIVFLV